jgi:hypothetical protein
VPAPSDPHRWTAVDRDLADRVLEPEEKGYDGFALAVVL